jgi:DNA-binding response OmpR family regulator
MIFLFLSDAGLRDAVVEQMAAQKWDAPQIIDNAQALLKNIATDAHPVVMMDQAGDKKYAAMLTALAALPNKPTILAIGSGEDSDNISESFVPPVRLGHLIARMKYYLETAPLLRDRTLSFGPFKLEPQNRRLIRDGADAIRLTEKETALLVFLAAQPQPVTRRDILAGVWGYDERIDTHTLETHIYQLRRKLDGDWLVNEAGAYRLVPSV